MGWVKRLINALWRKKRELVWKRQAAAVAREAGGISPDAREIDLAGRRILIVLPHPDDELIGCGEILARYGPAVDLFYPGLTGDDRSAENRATRAAEFARLCEATGARGLTADGDWPAALQAALEATRYDCIFLPSGIDWHPEHRLVCAQTLALAEEHSPAAALYLYCVTVPIPPRAVNAYAEQTADKWALFRAVYPSQTYMPLNRFRITERRYAVGGRVCEPYFEIRGARLSAVRRYFASADPARLDGLRAKINDLEAIHAASLAEYRELCAVNGQND